MTGLDTLNEFNLTNPVDPSAARPLLVRDQMLNSQFLALQRILIRTYEIAEREAYFARTIATMLPNDLTDDQPTAMDLRRPNQVFFIDGARGAGKTSVLLTLRYLMNSLGSGSEPSVDARPILNEIRKSVAEDSDINTVTEPTIPNLTNPKTFTFVAQHDVASGEKRRSALTFPIIHPADLEGRQPLLEGVFAVLGKQLDAQIERRKRDKGPTSEKLQLLELLRKTLIDDVAAGWYLSRDHGKDAILRDSLDFKEYLTLSGKAGSLAHFRVQNWRRFVNDFLDACSAQTMVLFLDDADNQPSVTLDILNTIRVFFDHPRIITVLAGNLKQIRQSVVIKEFEGLGDAMQTFRRAAPATEREWRQFARRHAEEFLEKVLPRPTRFYLTINDAAKPKSGEPARRHDEYSVILGGEMTFDKYSAKQMDLHRAEYFTGRLEADKRFRAGEKELQNDNEVQRLERFMSWWLLRFWYEDALRPKTVRHLLALRAFTFTNETSPSLIDRWPKAHQKRLPVILFENPDNQDLIHRFTDSDKSINKWLHRQIIKSEWVGDRFIEINDVKHYADTYPYSYILYRLDLDAALPVRVSGEGKVPSSLLPKLAGPNLITQPLFYSRIRKQRLTGIAAQLGHSLVPSNCYFLYGLTQLPDNTFEPGSDGSTRSSYTHRIVHEPETFFRLGQSDIVYDGRPATEKHLPLPRSEIKALMAEDIERYFTQIVVPVSALNFGKYILGRGSKGAAGQSMLLLKAELAAEQIVETSEKGQDGKDVPVAIPSLSPFNAGVIEAGTTLVGDVEYQDSVVKDNPFAKDALGEGQNALQSWVPYYRSIYYQPAPVGGQTDTFLPSRPAIYSSNLKQCVPLYRHVMNDVRRIWNAVRIFHGETSGPLDNWEDGKFQSPSIEPTSTAKVELPTRLRLRSWLGVEKAHNLFLERWWRDQPLAASPNVGLRSIIRNELLTPADELDRATICKILCAHAQEIGINLNAPSITPTVEESFRGGSCLIVYPASAEQNDRIEARIARSCATFVNAIAPALPSAIHLEVAAYFFKHRDVIDVAKVNQVNEGAAALIESWEDLVLDLATLIVRYWSLCEICKLTQDVLQHSKVSSPISNTFAGISPDFSYSTMGVVGMAAFFKNSEDANKATWAQSIAQPRQWQVAEGIQRSGLLWEATHNLRAAMLFCADMKAIKMVRNAKVPEAGA